MPSKGKSLLCAVIPVSFCRARITNGQKFLFEILFSSRRCICLFVLLFTVLGSLFSFVRFDRFEQKENNKRMNKQRIDATYMYRLICRLQSKTSQRHSLPKKGKREKVIMYGEVRESNACQAYATCAQRIQNPSH